MRYPGQHMVLERRRTRPSLSDDAKQAILDKFHERDNRLYPSGWNYYEQVVAKNPPNPIVCVPHQQTGSFVSVNLFADTVDDIMVKCGFPDSEREFTRRFYRSHLLSRLPYWDQDEVPENIPLLEE